MSDEEKKAIKELTEIKELVEEDLKYKDYEATAILDQIDLESLVICLNLIEKQQQEIEELEKKNKEYEKIIEAVKLLETEKIADDTYYVIAKTSFLKGDYKNLLNDFVSKDKIKAKIEPRLKELDEQMKKEWREYGNSREYQDMEDEWNFLQSLLEKE